MRRQIYENMKTEKEIKKQIEEIRESNKDSFYSPNKTINALKWVLEETPSISPTN